MSQFGFVDFFLMIQRGLRFWENTAEVKCLSHHFIWEVGDRTVTYPWWYLPRHSVRVVSAGFLHCLPIPCSVLWSTLLSTVRIQGEGSWALPLDGEGDTFSYIIGNSVRVCPLSPRIDSFTYLHYVSLIYFILWSFFFVQIIPSLVIGSSFELTSG